MFTRLQAQKIANSKESISDKSEYDSSNEMEDQPAAQLPASAEDSTGASGGHPSAISSDQIALLVSSITSLQACVEELRSDAIRNRQAVGASFVNAAATNTAQSPTAMSMQAQSPAQMPPPTSIQAQPPMQQHVIMQSPQSPSNILAMSMQAQSPAQMPPLTSIQAQPPMQQHLIMQSPQSPSNILEMSMPAQSPAQIPSPSTIANAQSSMQEHIRVQPPLPSTHIPLTSTQMPPRMLQTPTLNSAALTFMDNSSVKLFPLPNFDGNPEDWPLFLANYNDTTNEFQYSNRQNLMRLHKALQGAAKRAVTSLLIYPEDVPRVIRELEFNFGRPELLIKAQLQKVQRFQPIKENHLDQILDFSNRVRNIIAFFKSARCSHHLMNPTLLECLVGKLPPSKQYEWSQRAACLLPFPTVENFGEWLSEIAKVISLLPGVSDVSLRSIQTNVSQSTSAAQSRTITRHNGSATNSARRVLYNNEVQPETKNACIKCGQSHKLEECRQFLSSDIPTKWSFVKNNRLCFGCLRKGHCLGNCRQRKECSYDGCKRMHHKLLHLDASQSAPAIEEVERVLNCHNVKQSTLFKILPITLSGPNGSISAYAMFDEGSSITLLEENVATTLGLRGQTIPLTLQWYGESQVKENSRKVSVAIKGSFDEYNLRNVYTVKSLNLPSQSFDKGMFCHLQSLSITSYSNAKPVILLGLDNSYLGISNKTVDAGPNKPIATSTQLGWVVYGPLKQNQDMQPRVLHVRQSQSLQELHKLVNEYYTIDSFGVRSTNIILESDDNRRARAILEERTKEVGQKYEVGLLWRSDHTTLPPSFDMAYQRLQNLESRMSKDNNFAAKYKFEIEKYVQKGYARLLSRDEAAQTSLTTWYLPHFGVVNPHKPSKLRIVFDAAAATSKVSLNSVLLKGPEHAQSLIAVIHKFRQRSVAVAADIQEMFSQVAIRDIDQHAQRFLWRDGDRSKPVQVYVMSSMIFGAVCSPCCAEYIKNLNAKKYESTMPRGSTTVVNNMYVDDLVVSFVDAIEAEEVVSEVIAINSAAGFKLRNFVSNDKSLQAKLCGEEETLPTCVAMEHKSAADKVLGMFWNTRSDSFEFHVKFHKIPRDVLNCKRPPTKRELLGIAMAIYDPFGFLADVTIYVKLLQQSLWKCQTEWDEPIPQQLSIKWMSWWESFQNVSSFSVPRCYSELLLSADESQLHVFVDASSSAYAAVAYLRIKKGSNVDVAFVAAKSRCAPVKGMIVPRLELQAAVLGSRLHKSIVDCHDIKIHHVMFWSDSKTVLLWIKSTTREYKQFVASRIAEILSTTKSSQWRWLPTAFNVADDATRGKLVPKFDPNHRWLKGPEFLQRAEEYWPKDLSDFVPNDCAAEEKRTCLLLTSTTDEYILKFKNFSSYLKVVRVMSWVQRFIYNTKNRCRRKGELKAVEIAEAERALCRRVQEECFASEISELRMKQNVSKSSRIYALTPFLADDGLLRVNGRIDAAYCLPVSARRPVILPQHHYFTRLVLAYWHKKLHHQNDNLTINEVRQNFWVPHIRSVLMSIKKSCLICQVNAAKPNTPIMGQLPADRLTPFVRPFSYTGVDYCGPFQITIGRRREKRWIALFTCLTVRAVHLEVAEDLSTDAFLICLRNFVNRRGTPIRLRSDNGTNFIGAQKILKDDERLWDFNRVEQECAKRGIEWVFNCPANPSAGGCWERLVKCVKRLLQRVLKDEAPRLETFRSTLIEAENIINSRPLTDVPISPADEEPITPNHFLVGCVNSTQTPSNDEENICLRKQYRIAQALKDRLWKRWTCEYLPTLLCRSKWREKVEPLQCGDFVIICDPGLPRSQWMKGRIKEVITAKDGQVRSAIVKTSHAELRRPASKLAALNVREST